MVFVGECRNENTDLSVPNVVPNAELSTTLPANTGGAGIDVYLDDVVVTEESAIPPVTVGSSVHPCSDVGAAMAAGTRSVVRLVVDETGDSEGATGRAAGMVRPVWGLTPLRGIHNGSAETPDETFRRWVCIC